MPVRHYLPVHQQGHFRQICLTEFSSAKSEETILCLPGLLETSAAWHDFAIFLQGSIGFLLSTTPAELCLSTCLMVSSTE